MADLENDRPEETALLRGGEVENSSADSVDPAFVTVTAGGELPPDKEPEAKILPRGTEVGRYLVLEQIAAGGMGSVYRAFDPKLDRKVAVKVVTVAHQEDAAATSAALRLVREAKALAQLSHPNVVAVYDVGSYEDDVFIAMALVEGKTVREWNKLPDRSTSDILEVYLAAGRGLAAAHRAGIVHRDFKPDNVLIGDDGRVRVLDFGIALPADAEAIEPSSISQLSDSVSADDSLDSGLSLRSGTSRLTQHGSLVGTPPYMSPEQFVGGNVTTKTDQFSFCVALYESLYGQRPFEGRRVSELKRNVVAGRLREPPKDTRVPLRLRRIVERGLSVSPDDRYDSMDALLDELGDDPSLRRGRWLTLATVVGSIAVAGVAIGTGGDDPGARCREAGRAIESVWTPSSQGKIVKAFAEADLGYAADTAARVAALMDTRAQAWASTKRAVCEATWVRGEQSEALLDTRMRCLDRRLNETRSFVALMSGAADAELVGRAVQAAFSLEPVQACRDVVDADTTPRPPSDPDARARLDALNQRIDELEVMRAAGRAKQGVEVGDDVLAEADALGYAPAQTEVLLSLGTLLYDAGEFERAESLFERGISVAARAGDHKRGALIAAKRIIVLGYQLERPAEALAMVAGADAEVVYAEEDTLARAQLEGAIGTVMLAKGDMPAARDHMQRSQALLEAAWGEDDPRLARALNNLGLVLLRMSKYDEAIVALERSRAIGEQALGADHPSIAFALTNLGTAYAQLGRPEDSLRVQQRALKLFEGAHGPEHPNVAAVLVGIGRLLQEQGDLDQAELQFRRALAIQEAQRGPTHRHVGLALCHVAEVLIERDKLADALEVYQRAVEVFEASVGPDHMFTGIGLTGVGKVLVARGNPGPAIAPLERATRILESSGPTYAGNAQFELAKALWDAGRDRQRAQRLVEAVRTALPQQDDSEKLAREIEAWLAAHAPD